MAKITAFPPAGQPSPARVKAKGKAQARKGRGDGEGEEPRQDCPRPRIEHPRTPAQALAAHILDHPRALWPERDNEDVIVAWHLHAEGALEAIEEAAHPQWLWDEPWIWAGRCYRPGDDVLRAACLEAALALRPASLAAGSQGDALYKLARTRLKGDALTPVATAARWDAQPRLPVRNGTLDLSNPQRPTLRPGWSPADRMTYAVEAAWDPAAADPAVTGFLETVLPDPDIREAVLEFFGLALARWDRRGQAVLFLLGAGANGKSTLLRALKALSPEHTTQISLRQLVEDRFATADLIHAVWNLVGDQSADFLRDTAAVKQITGGDALRAQHKNRDAFSLVPKVRLVYAVNDMPRSADQSHGWHRRLLIARFPRHFSGDEAARFDEAALTTPAARATWLRLLVEAYGRFDARSDFDWGAPGLAAEKDLHREATDIVARALAEGVLDLGGPPDPPWTIAPTALHLLLQAYAGLLGQEAPREAEVVRRLEDLARSRGLPPPRRIRRRTDEGGRQWLYAGIRAGWDAWAIRAPRPSPQGDVALVPLARLAGLPDDDRPPRPADGAKPDPPPPASDGDAIPDDFPF